MANVSMSYEAVSTAAKSIESAKTNLDEAVANISRAASNLSSGYTGEGYEAFKNAWEELQPKIKEMNEAIAAFAPKLNQAAARIKEAEDANKASF